MDSIEVPLPEQYVKLVERLDDDLDEDVYKELGKRMMDVINQTAKMNMRTDNESEEIAPMQD